MQVRAFERYFPLIVTVKRINFTYKWGYFVGI